MPKQCKAGQQGYCPATYKDGCPIVCERLPLPPGAPGFDGFNEQQLRDALAEVNADKGVEITYIAGPMTGYHNWNIPAFVGMAARLREAGLTVVNPAELHKASHETPWDWYLRRDLAELVKCQRVVLLPGWANSRGAIVEQYVAKALGLEIVYPESFEEWFVSVHR